MRIRDWSSDVCSSDLPLSDADATVQSMEDASPAKWHLAHTTWFFESFVLRDHVPGYQLFDARWPFLFNRYYEAEGPRYARPSRGKIGSASCRASVWQSGAITAVAVSLKTKRCK